MKIDLSKLTKTQLLGIRAVLVSGAEATATKTTDTNKRELADLRKEKQFKEIVASYGLDFDDDPDYYLSIPEKALAFVCKKLQAIAKEATADVHLRHTFNVPPIRGRDTELEGSEYVKEQLRLRKNGGKG